uniref:HTH cro/C1-type domain-containing protein n=1 Tax=Candidatus Kentrum sp. FM TaxID=2126340 RepID=A0A450TG98_9GAMM|nr:MAG: hypothetical protein BECKFM1743C_GA0114222_104162 [Candidatus Kentron sp. FM]VFJ66288.1 MAG: hypothetical protein BECKFM1743A_GA0114220_104075 [Candidatus Kentron sp. FM]VFK09246.1 MAG: hypothetical protein BECKFM1743B_GA0114221_100994 [Candidatus Kentron sp. FM]
MTESSLSIKSPLDYLDQLMEQEHLSSDYQLSKHLDVSRQLVSNWRHNRAIMDSFHCWKLADALDLDEREIEAAANYQRDKIDKKKEYWLDKWKSLADID